MSWTPGLCDPAGQFWYVLHCEPQRDRQVERLMAAAGLRVFGPRIPRTRKRNGDRALFPGYLFVRLDLSSGIWGGLRFTPGVRRLVDIGGAPCPVDDRLVEAIRHRVECWQPSRQSLEVGDRVVVAVGSFADLEGIFSERLSGDDRAAILLDLMRRQVRVELPVDCLRPL